MKFGELVEHTIECIKTFNPVYKTIDSHADEFLANVSAQIIIHNSLVQRSLRKSIYKTSILWLHTLRRILENILQSIFFSSFVPN